MARDIIGDPATVNWVLVSGQPVTAGENSSGITIRSAHEQYPVVALNVYVGSA
jgi:hypothetical protein